MTFYITERPTVDFTPRTAAQTAMKIGKAFRDLDGDAVVRGVLAGGIAAALGANSSVAAAVGGAINQKMPVGPSVFTPQRDVWVYSNDPLPEKVRQHTQSYIVSTRLIEQDPRGDVLVEQLTVLGYEVTGHAKEAVERHWRLESHDEVSL